MRDAVSHGPGHALTSGQSRQWSRPAGRGVAGASLLALLVACGGPVPDADPSPSTDAPTTETPTTDAPTTATPEPPLDVTNTSEIEVVALPAEYAPSASGLRLTYTVVNDGDVPVLVADERGHDQSSSAAGPGVPEAVWVGAGADDGVARLSKQIFEVPPGILLERPWEAPATRVEPGDAVEGTAVVPLPVSGDLPLTNETLIVDDEPLRGPVDAVEMCVQIAPDTRQEPLDPIYERLTNDTRDRALVCTDPQPIPEG